MRMTISFLLLCALAACGGGSSAPEQPSSPTLARDEWLFDSTRASTNHEIFLMKADGSGIRRLTNDALYENWWPRVSPDRKRVLFYRAPAGLSEHYELASLWVMNADGSGLTQLRAQGSDGWVVQGHGEWSPDGKSIAMFGGSGANPQIFVANAQGTALQQRTNRPGVNTDVSWSPDGQWLLFNGCPGLPCTAPDYELYIMPSAGGTATRLTTNSVADYDPYFSPDGRSIAWLSTVDTNGWGGLGFWSIGMASISNGATGWVTSNQRWLINDGQINSKAAWSLDGQQIFFHRIAPLEETLWGLFRINPDGTGLTRLTSTRTGNNEHPSN